MMPRGWMVAPTLFALTGLPIGAGSGAAASPSVAALSLIASPPPALPPANPHFAISDLGTLGGETSSASSLNDLWQVVGSSLISAGAEHAFLYSAGRMSELGTLGNASDATWARSAARTASASVLTLSARPPGTRLSPGMPPFTLSWTAAAK